jgi:lipid-A-disaccharide synthase
MAGGFSARAGMELIQEMSVIADAHQSRGWLTTAKVKETTSLLLSEIKIRKPKFAVLIDLPQYHLELAAQISRLGIPVFQYVAPRHWFHGKDVLGPLAANYKKVYGTFPFEEKYYSQLGVRFGYVGSPIIERVRKITIHKKDLGLNPDWPHLSLYSGSRISEVKFGLPRLLNLAERLSKHFSSELSISISIANGLALSDFLKLADGRLVPVSGEIRQAAYELLDANRTRIFLFTGSGGELMKASDVAVVTPGTSTLECAALGTPFCVFGEVGVKDSASDDLFSRLKRSLMVFSKFRPVDSKVFKYGEFKSLVNLTMGRQVVREFGVSGSDEGFEEEVIKLISDREYTSGMKKDFDSIRSIFQPGVSERVASDIIRETAQSLK